MLLQHLLFVSAYAIATTNAVVKFYGSERPDGDYVTCEVPDVADEDVYRALAIYFPAEAVEDEMALEFEEPLMCGDLYSITVEFACHDLGGNSTCIPTDPATDTDTDTDSENDAKDDPDADDETTNTDPEAISERSLTHLSKRTGFHCNEWTGQCQNQYESPSTRCPSGYDKEILEIGGYVPQVWCKKPCTKEERKECKKQGCAGPNGDCEKTGDRRKCTQALQRCVGLPVKTDEEMCTSLQKVTKYGSGFVKVMCKDDGTQCFSYSDGACTMNEEKWKAYMDLAIKSIFAELKKGPGP
jgi:hypothetical protein